MIDALYFDGQSTQGHFVTLIIHKKVISMRGEGIHRSVPLSEVHISERLGRAPRILRFGDGATVEISDPHFDKMLSENRHQESRVSGWQQKWSFSLFALIVLAVVLVGGYRWGLPLAADGIAQTLPASVDKKLGEEGLKMLDAHFMEPTKLSLAEQTRLRNLFAQMKQPHGDKTAYRLEFRRSKIGPNALALPNGVIIMTDELVTMAGNDHAVLGVLGHELGHIRHRHSTRRLLQAVGMGFIVHALVGDVSSVLAGLPTFLLDQKYSRDFERESDDYAIDMMQANRMPLSPMADFFVKLKNMDDDDELECEADASKSGKEKRGTGSGAKQHATLDYLSSHPSNDERIARLRAADGKI